MRKELFVLWVSLLAFFCIGNAWAQKTISTYQGLKDAVTEWEEGWNTYTTQKEKLTADRSMYEKQKTDNEGWYNSDLQNRPDEKIYHSETKKTYNEVYSAVKAFTTAMSAHYGKTSIDETDKNKKISFRIEYVYDEDEEDNIYTLQISVPSVVGSTNGWKETTAASAINALTTTTSSPDKSYYYLTSDNSSSTEKRITPKFLVFVYKDINGETIQRKTSVQGYLGGKLIISSSSITALSSALSNSVVTDVLITNETILVGTDNPNFSLWDNRMKGYQLKIEEAETEIQKIDKQLTELSEPTPKTYKLTADIIVTNTDLNDTGLNTKTWPKGLTLDGGFHRIEGLSANTPLFNENAGTIENLISQDGSIAKTNSGMADNVFVQTSAKKFRVYSENNYTDFDDVVSAVKANSTVFGYNLDAKKVEAAEAANKLYTATYYYADNKSGSTFDINVKEGTITDGNDLASYPTDNNQFIYVNDTNITESIDMQNVVVNGTCQRAKIVEGADKAEFYIPEGFTAVTLDYDRDIQTDVVSVCLPFALSSDFMSDLKAEGIQMYYYGYKGVDMDTKTVWFSYKGTNGANTPCVLAFEKGTAAGKIFNKIKNARFESTPAEMAIAATDQTDGDDAKRFRGNYKPGQLTGNVTQAAGSMGSDVYGFREGKLVRFNDMARINQFRSFVIYSQIVSESQSGAMLQARFVDENGNEMTGIGNAVADRADNGDGLKAFGGSGAIEIDAEKACDVRVYTAGGAPVKSLRVEAGHTSLPVSAGIYIVNKNKVVVK